MNKYSQIAIILIICLNIAYFCKTATDSVSPVTIVAKPKSTSTNSLDAAIKNLKDKIVLEEKDNFINDLRKELKSEKSESILADIEKELYHENRDSILEQLKSKFYAENKHEILKSLKGDYNKQENALAHTLQEDVLQYRLDFFSSVLNDIMIANKPKSEPLTEEEIGINCTCSWYYDVQSPSWTIDWLSQGKTSLEKDKFDDLQLNHDAIVKELRRLEYPPNVFTGRGIVINGGGVYFGSALIAVRQLRELGSKLPIELVLNDESEYDPNICEVVLPKLNGRCTIISRVVGAELHDSLKLEKFQLKAMGIFISSFEEMIVLDADNFPIKNVDDLFDTPMYEETQFLMWPDVWHKGTSPLYYDIARFQLGEPVRRNQVANDQHMSGRSESALHDLDGAPPDLTVETGQMVFSKKTHLRSLLLALYYNMYGLSHYYRLLYQGTCGEGDKDTFIAALHVFHEPYYLNEYPSWLAGYYKPYFQETTIIQHDIYEARNYNEGFKIWLRKNGIDSRLNSAQRNDYTRKLLDRFEEESGMKKPSVQFLHIHNPKPNPINNFDGEVYDIRHLGPPNGDYASHWSPDWELKVYSISQWVACDVLDKQFYEKLNKDGDAICNRVREHVEFLKRDSPDSAFAELTDIGF